MITWLGQQTRENVLIHALVFSLSIFICYIGLWNAYFWSDDFWMLGWVRHYPRLGDAIWAQFGYGVRFLLDASLWIRVRLFDLNAAPYYWLSLLQHIAVAGVVYAFALVWTKRRNVAFLTALLFGTSFAHFTVVTWITGSEYSEAAILYLGSLGFFALYLKQRRLWWYMGALIAFVLLLLFLEMSLSLPLLLLAYHVTLGRGSKSWHALNWRDLALHLPFWILTAAYLVLQFRFVQSGSSEATVAADVYQPGFHMLRNLYYLVYLIVPPDVHYGVLEQLLGPVAVQIAKNGTLVVAILGNVLAIYGVWKGSALIRFAIALIYIPFLPYTLWQGSFAGAIRYRYLPAIGFSLLLALFFSWLYGRLQTARPRRYRLAIPVTVIALLLANLVMDQAWVRRHVENSALRRAFVTELVADYRDLEAGARLYIEVPADKYRDLQDACTLVFEQAVHCTAFVAGEGLPQAVAGEKDSGQTFWLKATAEGVAEIFAPGSASQ